MDDSERDDLKLGEGDLKDRAALGRLPALSPTEAAEAERSASEVLYPERNIRSQPHSREGAAPLAEPAHARGYITLAALEDAIMRDATLDERRRAHLLAHVRALSTYHDEIRAGRPRGGAADDSRGDA
jgi:hypothetical protein